jgi:hypothetical protein
MGLQTGFSSLQEPPVFEQSSQQAFLGLFLPEVLLALDALGLKGDETSILELWLFLPEAEADLFDELDYEAEYDADP